MSQTATAVADTYTITIGQTLTVAGPGVLVNDSFAPGNSYSVFSGPGDQGSATFSPDGGFAYVPPAGFSGTVTGTYCITAGFNSGPCLSNVAMITVNVVPTAPDQHYTTPFNSATYCITATFGDGTCLTAAATITIGVGVETGTVVLNSQNYEVPGGKQLVVPAPGILLGATLPPGTSYTVYPFCCPGDWTADFTWQPDGGFTFDATGHPLDNQIFATYCVTSTFMDLPNPACIGGVSASIFVQPGPPTAVDDAYTVAPGAALDVATPGVLGNDRPPPGEPISARLNRPPTHGTVDMRPDGSFSYHPAEGFTGTDTFTYDATDRIGAVLGTATVDITVAPAITTVSGPLARTGIHGTRLLELALALTAMGMVLVARNRHRPSWITVGRCLGDGRAPRPPPEARRR